MDIIKQMNSNIYIYIDHDESNSMDGYKGVCVKSKKEELFRSNTGDPTKDWEKMREFIGNIHRSTRILLTSSVDHFLHDIAGFYMDDNGNLLYDEELSRAEKENDDDTFSRRIKILMKTDGGF